MTLSTSPESQDSDREVCVIKRSAVALSQDNVRQALIFFPIVDSAFHSLYLSLRSVYSPRLLATQGLDSKTAQAMSEVEIGLHRALVQVRLFSSILSNSIMLSRETKKM